MSEDAELASLKIENREIRVGDSSVGKVLEDGTLKWAGDVELYGDIQTHGKQVELWQTVVATGDNHIRLNDGIRDAEPPYSGIEVNRGKETPSAYLVWSKEEKRWSVAIGSKKKTVALHGDPLSKFKNDLTTDHVIEGKENKYFTSARVASSVEAGKGIGAEKTENGVKLHQVPQTTTHNFWVSNKVVPTVGTDREVLPAIISSSEREERQIKSVRCRLSSGRADVAVLRNGEQVGDPIKVSAGDISSKKCLASLQDKDTIGIGIGETEEARNLSVSIVVETRFS